MAAEMKADSAKKEAAAKLREAAAEISQAWNYRMIGYGGTVHLPEMPSLLLREREQRDVFALEPEAIPA
jgi:hypothetical protein